MLAAAAAAALCVSLAPEGRAAAAPRTADARTTAKGASTAADGTSGPYAFAEDAIAVKGAAGTTDSVLLRPGRTYKSSVGLAGRDGRLYYRLELGADSDAYVSATAVPRPGATVSYSDGLKVSLQDANGRNCSFTGTVHFGATQSPHPIAAWASRETSGTPARRRERTTWSSNAPERRARRAVRRSRRARSLPRPAPGTWNSAMCRSPL
jgi:hypothetical protein